MVSAREPAPYGRSTSDCAGVRRDRRQRSRRTNRHDRDRDACPRPAAGQAAPAADVGERGLPRRRRADPTRCRGALRGCRPQGRLARPRRRVRKRQRRDRRRPARLRRRRRRLRPRAPRPGPPARGGRGARRRPRRGRRRVDPVPGRQLRRRGLGVRGDVRPRPCDGVRGARARVPPRWPNRARRVDARRVHRRDAEGRREARAAGPGRRVAAPLGHEGPRWLDVRRRRRRARLPRTDVHVPLPLRGGLRRVLPRLLRPDAEGVRGPRGRRGRRALRRSRRARPEVRRHLRGPVAIPATWLETVATRSGRAGSAGDTR